MCLDTYANCFNEHILIILVKLPAGFYLDKSTWLSRASGKPIRQALHLNYTYTHTLHSPQSHFHRPLPRTLRLSAYTQTIVHASQSPHPHRVRRQPYRQTKDDHITKKTAQAHRPTSKSERNLIILLVKINGIKNKPEELKLLTQDTHADINTIQETKLTLKQTPPKYITSPCAPAG